MKNFPDIDPASAAHSEKVRAHIQSEISNNGPITFARFMELALYAPGLGYYVSGARKFGAEGDFITAPEISPLFSRCLARQFQAVLSDLGGGDILEFGAGTGVMAADILQELQQRDAMPNHYYILEVSAELKQRQQALLKQRVPEYFSRVVWLDRLPSKPLNGVVVANEVLDAMPVHKFKTQEGVQEFFVDYKNETFVWHIQPTTNQTLKNKVDVLQLAEGYESEINLHVDSWINSIANTLNHGAVFLIDYGFMGDEYYHPQRAMGTLMCHFRQHSHSDPLILAGVQDITAHVDFSAVEAAAVRAGFELLAFSNQARFLLESGIADMVASGDAKELFNVNQQIKMLTLPSEMGELFKVMVLAK